MNATTEEFKLGMRRLAGGVSLITSVFDGQPYGLVATSVASVSADPATLLVCVNQGTSAHGPIVQSGKFCVNLLRHEDQGIAAPFGSRSRAAERFAHGDWTTTAGGALALASALAWFDCEIEQQVPSHSHTIFIARVRQVHLGPDSPPLVYFNQEYATVQ
jgi:flavin reductase